MSSNPVAIITGGCSGMGEAFTKDLASKGWQVAMFDIKGNDELVSSLNGAATFHKCNVADYDEQGKCFQEVWNKYGRLDLVCPNAGISDRSSLYAFEYRGSDSIPPKPDTTCTDVNVKGVYYSVMLGAHFMRKNQIPGGNIVVTASAASLYPHQTYVEYSGSKAAVWHFVRSTARVLKTKDNIRINSIRPGSVPTSIAPPGLIAAVGDNVTPISTIVTALNKLLGDDSIYGQSLECSKEKIIATPEPEYLNGESSKRSCFLWEPGFQMLHKEPSELPEAIP